MHLAATTTFVDDEGARIHSESLEGVTDVSIQ